MKNIIKVFIISVFIILIHLYPSFSEEISDVNKELNIDTELDKEFEWLHAETTVVTTEIATKTKMDAELTPGMVTVLSGKDLKNRGIRNVYEAMSLVPGLRTSIDSIGDKLISVRGIGGSLLSGNLKLMLNNVVLNDTLSATGYVLHGIPVEQVDRIEIIRGPGSVIYGEYAYAGVINVITRQKGNGVYAYYDGNDGYGGGGIFTYEEPEKELSLNLNLSGWKSDGPDVDAGEDRLYSSLFGMDVSEYSYSPGSTNEAQEDRMANLSFRYKDFSILWQYLLNGNGDYFGIVHALPPDNDRIVSSHEHRAVEARQRLNFSESLNAEFKACGRRYVYEGDSLVVLPPNMPLPNGISLPPEGNVMSPHYEERELFIGAEMLWEKISGNTFLAGAKYSDIATEDIWVEINTSEENWGETIRVQGENNWIAEDRTRKIFSLYLQDMLAVTDYFTLTGGLRYDHYEDNESSIDSITPRISGVLQITDSHILKAQYSEAMRPPSFSELYSVSTAFKGNPELDPEKIRSYELGYIYRHQKITGRITLFYSELKDNIAYPQYAESLGGVGIQYENAEDKINTIGFEAEFEKSLRPDLRLNANVSFSDTEDEETGEPLENAIEWMGNAGITYEPLKDVMLFALQYRYVGSPHRAADDDREEIDAYHTLNLTANFFNLFAKGVTLRWGIKNLFDDDIVYPSPIFQDAEKNLGYFRR